MDPGSRRSGGHRPRLQLIPSSHDTSTPEKVKQLLANTQSFSHCLQLNGTANMPLFQQFLMPQAADLFKTSLIGSPPEKWPGEAAFAELVKANEFMVKHRDEANNLFAPAHKFLSLIAATVANTSTTNNMIFTPNSTPLLNNQLPNPLAGLNVANVDLKCSTASPSAFSVASLLNKPIVTE
ncbi:hypothetical protein M3Y97_00478400 [Aphelenchoides bicaudatus]|nr:hypothetical protein M3Y97_00478400 [Aphelenchoides bicaudatus]